MNPPVGRISEATFQRARRPEQIGARRSAILAVARHMLRERRSADISLRELSEEVGLAKSNVLRYFDSREAIFLEILDADWIEWLDAVEPVLDALEHSSALYADEEAVATVLAETLIDRPLLCDLVSAMAGELERNISVEFARSFKCRASANSTRLADMVRRELPILQPDAAAHFAGAVFVIIAGLWPYATPTEAVATVTAELGYPSSQDTFRLGLREGFVNQLVGLTARARALL
jgi:AcrR family transcriptional regulator